MYSTPLNTLTGLLVVGLQNGEVKTLLVEWDPENEQTNIHEHSVWTDHDNLAPKVFDWIEKVF